MTTLLGERSHGARRSGNGAAGKASAAGLTHSHLFDRREAGRLLKDELLRLPEKYRSPVVLCYLEGRTHEEAAAELGCPTGSMSRRLKRAQSILRRRLIHRGFSFAVGLFAVAVRRSFGVEHLPQPKRECGRCSTRRWHRSSRSRMERGESRA